MGENRDNNTGNDIISDELELSKEMTYEDGTLDQTNQEKKHNIANSDLNLQKKQLFEKSDGAWKCKVCGKATLNYVNMWQHAERHEDGMSHACHICNKSFSNRPGLRCHINQSHSELFFCDLCGKSGMNKQSYYNHKHRQHKILSGTL